MYKLQLTVKKGEISLSLKNGRKTVDVLAWTDDVNMSEKLLVEIDKILRKNEVKKEEVRKMVVRGDIPAGYSTMRIARTAVNAWNWGINSLIVDNRGIISRPRNTVKI